MSCDCEFTVDPEETEEESWHYLRKCLNCEHTWFGLHCPHDGVQNPCPMCMKRPETVSI